MTNDPTASIIWTFLPGIHGTEDLYEAVRKRLPEDIEAEFVNLPSTGKQDYATLCDWLDLELPKGQKRFLIAESFSGPLAIRLASRRPEDVVGLTLAVTFCDTPLNPGIALLPLRSLFMVKPPRKALRHFLIGDEASDAEVERLRSFIQTIPSSTLTKRVRTVLELSEDDNPALPDLPILILHAQNDGLIPWEAQTKLEACYPQASAHWIESPHLVFQQQPEEAIARLLEFHKSLL